MKPVNNVSIALSVPVVHAQCFHPCWLHQGLSHVAGSLINNVTEGEILCELDFWKSLWALYLRHLRMCKKGVEGVVLSDHLFGCHVLGRILSCFGDRSVVVIACDVWNISRGTLHSKCSKDVSKDFTEVGFREYVVVFLKPMIKPARPEF